MPTVTTDNGEMIVEIDWLSVSIPLSSILTSAKNDPNVKSVYAARERKMLNLIMACEDLKEGGGRAPFKKTFHSKSGGFTYFESDNLPYCLIEFTGVGCEVLRSYGWMKNILQDWNDRITRLDIACDIATDIDPIKFTKGRSDENNFSSSSNVISESGITSYVGSKASNRYCRVYRYNSPHPRSDLLRVEFVLRNEYAKQCAKILVDTPIYEIIKGLYKTFGWEDFSDLIKGNGMALASTPKETHQGKTERWLLTQVLPALGRMAESGNVEFIVLFQKKLAELQSRG